MLEMPLLCEDSTAAATVVLHFLAVRIRLVLQLAAAE